MAARSAVMAAEKCSPFRAADHRCAGQGIRTSPAVEQDVARGASQVSPLIRIARPIAAAGGGAAHVSLAVNFHAGQRSGREGRRNQRCFG
jgi:hypothetical protein